MTANCRTEFKEAQQRVSTAARELAQRLLIDKNAPPRTASNEGGGALAPLAAGLLLPSLLAAQGALPDSQLVRALTYRNAYQTDLWQELIDGGFRVEPVLIDGQWREIDTGQDLDRARRLVDSTTEWT